MMTWQELEKIFNRALRLSFSKRKFALVFPVLALCGLFAVICKALSQGAGQWIQMSLGFLPIFLCAGLLLGVGIVLIRIYHHEVKDFPLQYLETIKKSFPLFMGIPYFAVPIIFAYLVLWMFLGVFYLLRAIPGIGSTLGSILSFGPFLLVFGSLLLSLLSLITLFFLTPAASLRSHLKPQLAVEIWQKLKENPFLCFIMPLIALFPILLVTGFLSLAAVVTHIMYIDSTHGLSIILKWLFMMVPFSAVLTPAVIFFFHFSAETHSLMHKQTQTQ